MSGYIGICKQVEGLGFPKLGGYFLGAPRRGLTMLRSILGPGISANPCMHFGV